ncbi:type I-E CRISPR-associated protein Cas7/Cse4/CasC [Brevibacterium album]|uniref:type I-E CRISPR-associated protein Cas7/Cse4/CasC n=1 Tax=Brevibacterium album TaxID=417948 RepID=UPI0003F79B8A|nr:type I-E CRISPR-associated protein Cas7/Cse4/CasC [Brevibacterium album]
MSKAFLDIHIIQPVPPSNVNRDDTGAPKTAFYGGVRRARVSSQAWKRATRSAFHGLVDKSRLGVRTQRVIEQIAEKIAEIDPALKGESEALAAEVIKTVGITTEKPKPKKDEAGQDVVKAEESAYLVFFSSLQIEKAARRAVEDQHAGIKPNKKIYKAILQQDNSLDIALFGRMIADLTDLGVDASAQVAHALSVHAVESESDFYTAVDDWKRNDPDRDAGAGMLGTIEFNSSTLYRYATVSLQQLHENLGSAEAVREALTAFAQGFVESMPTGKANTFANQTLPAAVVFAVRTDRPVSLVGAFERPVTQDGGFTAPAVKELVKHAKDLAGTYDAPVGYWTAGAGELAQPLDELAERASLRTAAEAAASAALEKAGLAGTGGSQ